MYNAMYVFMRLVSLILVVIALMLLGADAVTSLEHNHITVRTLADVWDLFERGGAEAFKASNAAHLPGFVAWAISAILGCWGWAVSGVLGVILAFAFGRRHESE